LLLQAAGNALAIAVQIPSEAIGKIEKDDTRRHYDKNHNRTGYSKAYKNKEVMFDNFWNRKGYKK